MFTCILNAMTSSLLSGALVGLIISFLWGPFSAMGRRAETRIDWNKKKQKYGGAWKTWFRMFLPITLVAFVVLFIAQVINCF